MLQKKYDIVWDGNTFTVKFKGAICLQDTMSAYDDWVSDPRFEAIDSFITDLRDVEEIIHKEGQIRMNALYSKSTSRWIHNKTVYVGFVVPNNKVEEIVCQFIEYGKILNTNWVREIFYEIDEAKSWTRKMIDQNLK